MHRRTTLTIVTLICLTTLASGLLSAPRARAAADADPAFTRTWTRTDQPVASGAVSRSWIWGPEARTPAVVEPYDEAPGHMRLVQYWDKARMEITDPASDPNASWHVTTGLLATELVTGRVQLGDDEFEDWGPAEVNVAGDQADLSGPTYASFGALLDAPPLAEDAVITQRVSRAGVVSDDADLAAYGVTASERVQEPGLDHRVASVFWEFMQSSGLVNDDGELHEAALFENPFYATGFPIAEAYWTTVPVGGESRDVLVQVFQRRVLTYTPANPAAWQVELGNIGQHYLTWRHEVGPEREPSVNLSQLVDGLIEPTAMVLAPDGRLFVTEQGGTVRIVRDGQLLQQPFVTVPTRFASERGLIGIALDPDFASNGYVYLHYTVFSSPAHNRVSRFTADGDVAVPNSELILLELDNLTSAENHNGGALHFGPDGMLYVAVGDNGYGPNAQNLAHLGGKLLRLRPDGSIPEDNPLYAETTGRNRAIWALGLRNPFSFAFQPVTGRLFINNVGQSTYEEIDEGVAGANYGWPSTEGPTDNPAYTGPLYYYDNSDTDEGGCAISAGAFLTPTEGGIPAESFGDYLFTDFCRGWLHTYDPVTGTVRDLLGDVHLKNPVALEVAEDGTILVLERATGSIRVIVIGDRQ